MAGQKLKGKFYVIPRQFEQEGEDAEPIRGVVFPNASKAQSFVDDVRKAMHRAYLKAMGIEAPDKPAETATEDEKTAYKTAKDAYDTQVKGLKTFIPMQCVLQVDGQDNFMEFEDYLE